MNRRHAVIIGVLVVVTGAAVARPFIAPALAPAVRAPAGAIAFTESTASDAHAAEGDRAAPAASSGPTVNVAGAVRVPGVYALPAAARLVAAVHAAGGLASDADAEAVDLAAYARDGELIVVPKRGERARTTAAIESGASDAASSGSESAGEAPVDGADAAPATRKHRHRARKRRHRRHAPERADAAGASDDAAAGASADSSRSTALDINTASADELATLPGVGDVLAERIVRFRQLGGPFSRTEELLDVEGMTDSRYEGIADEITIGRP